jgi:hypothetical protein
MFGTCFNIFKLIKIHHRIDNCLSMCNLQWQLLTTLLSHHLPPEFLLPCLSTLVFYLRQLIPHYCCIDYKLVFYQLKNCYPAFQRPQLWFVADYFAVFLSKTIMIRHCRLYFGIVFCSPTTILFEVDLYFASCLITDCYLDVSLSTIYMVILTCVWLVFC